MKTNQPKPTRRSKFNDCARFIRVRRWQMAGLFVLLLGGAALWWLPGARMKIVGADSRVQVVGTLSPQDVAEIKRIARREIWRGILPKFDWWSVRQLPASIRAQASERAWITVQADGAVSVVTNNEEWGGGAPPTN